MKTTCLFFILIAVLGISFTEASFCPTAGFFPDPSSCEGFTMCYDDPTGRGGLIGVDMKCPANMAYDREAGYCTRQALAQYC